MAKGALPSRTRIIAYWQSEEGRARWRFKEWAGSDCCFCCGAPHPQRAHIVPRQRGGPNVVENLVLLCKACHEDSPDSTDPRHLLEWIDGGPPAMARANARLALELEQFGDHVLEDLARVDEELVNRYVREALGSFGMHGFGTSPGTIARVLKVVHERLDAERLIPAADDASRIEKAEKGVGLYHEVWLNDTFDHAAKALFRIVRSAEDDYPGVPRLLYVDVHGHRDESGEFDDEIRQLDEFVRTTLALYVTSYPMLLTGEQGENPQQRNDVPERITVLGRGATGGKRASVRAQLLAARLAETVDTLRPPDVPST